MTQVQGIAYGVIVAFFAIVIIFAPSFRGTPIQGVTLFITLLMGGAFLILSLGITFIAGIRRKSVFGTTNDGFISGFTGLFGVVSVVTSLSNGQWPLIFG